MTSDLARAVKGSSGFLNGPDPCKDLGPFGVCHANGEQGRFGTPQAKARGQGLPKQSNKDGHWQ